MNIANVQRLSSIYSDFKEGKSIEDRIYEKAQEAAVSAAKSIDVKAVISGVVMWLLMIMGVVFIILKPGWITGLAIR